MAVAMDFAPMIEDEVVGAARRQPARNRFFVGAVAGFAVGGCAVVGLTSQGSKSVGGRNMPMDMAMESTPANVTTEANMTTVQESPPSFSFLEDLNSAWEGLNSGNTDDDEAIAEECHFTGRVPPREGDQFHRADHSAKDIDECREICNDPDEDCVSLSFTEKRPGFGENCIIHREVFEQANISTTDGNAKWITETKGCEVRSEKCDIIMGKIPGSALKEFEDNLSESQCRLECKAKDKCGSFTYGTGGICLLFETKTLPGNDTVGQDVYMSYTRACIEDDEDIMDPAWSGPEPAN